MNVGVICPGLAAPGWLIYLVHVIAYSHCLSLMYFPLKVNRLSKIAVVLLLGAIEKAALSQEILVGSVKSVHGGAVILRGPVSIPVREGAHLILNDLVQTSRDGAIGAILQDGTRLSLGPDTEFKIDRFLYQPAEGKFGLLIRLSRGALAYISGKIAQFSPGSVSVETPEAVLGLRGTEFIVSVDSSVPVNRSAVNPGPGKNGI